MTKIQSIGAKKTVLDDLNLHGYVRLPFKIGKDELESLRTIFEDNVGKQEAGKRFSGNKAVKILSVLETVPAFFEAVGLVLGKEAVITRSLFLRKSNEVNWPLPWHQDVTLITKVSSEIPAGFGPVTYKDGLPHVTATAQFLAGMVSARIHLDDADKESGALEIIPGSHKNGRIPPRIMEQEIMGRELAYVPAQCGEIHLFRPLLLHRSGKVVGEVMRRVIQLEMTPRETLPQPLEWLDPVPLFSPEM